VSGVPVAVSRAFQVRSWQALNGSSPNGAVVSRDNFFPTNNRSHPDMVDVSQHELVPEHTLIEESEVESVLSEYDVERAELPKIKRKDPALPDDAAVGDVVRIVRDSRTTDKAVSYRLVVE